VALPLERLPSAAQERRGPPRTLRQAGLRADALKAEVIRLASSRQHWMTKHDRAYAVAMHNERVIAEMENRTK
jgi:hypothetical protein